MFVIKTALLVLRMLNYVSISDLYHKRGERFSDKTAPTALWPLSAANTSTVSWLMLVASTWSFSAVVLLPRFGRFWQPAKAFVSTFAS